RRRRGRRAGRGRDRRGAGRRRGRGAIRASPDRRRRAGRGARAPRRPRASRPAPSLRCGNRCCTAPPQLTVVCWEVVRRGESTSCLSDDERDQLTRSPGADFFATIDPHLTTCASCRELVTKLVHADASPSRPPRARTAGERFGRYVILDVLGAGAMGMVYAARDPYLDRKIAIKVLKPRAGDASLEARARMVKEARAIARLAHPNVIHIYDVGFE